MTASLSQAILDLMSDPDGKRAEDILLGVITDLERSGIKPEPIAEAMSRILLSYCMHHGPRPDHFGWVYNVLSDTGKKLKKASRQAHRRWVRKFMKRAGRLYSAARFEIHVEQPVVRQALDEHLSAMETKGHA